jgi:hypothetical protein
MGGYGSQSQPLGLGYPGLPYSQGYPFLNPSAPINNPYLYPSTPAPVTNYVFPCVFSNPYQSSPYSLWQPYSNWQSSYNQPLWPY